MKWLVTLLTIAALLAPAGLLADHDLLAKNISFNYQCHLIVQKKVMVKGKPWYKLVETTFLKPGDMKTFPMNDGDEFRWDVDCWDVKHGYYVGHFNKTDRFPDVDVIVLREDGAAL